MATPLPATPPWPSFFGRVAAYDGTSGTYVIVDLENHAYGSVPPNKLSVVGGLTARMARCYGIVVPGGRGS